MPTPNPYDFTPIPGQHGSTGPVIVPVTAPASAVSSDPYDFIPGGTSTPASGGSAPPQVAQAGAPTKGGGGLLHLVGKGLGQIGRATVGAGTGLLSLGEESAALGRGATANIINDLTLGHTHLGPASAQFDPSHPVASEKEVGATLNQYPTLDAMRAGYVRTGEEIAHPSRIVTNYSQNPGGAFLNDAANIASVAAPVTGALGAFAEGAGAGAEGAGAGAEGAAKAAAATSKVAEAAGKAANLPTLPARLVAKGVGSLADMIPAGTDAATAEKVSLLDKAKGLGTRVADTAAQRDAAATFAIKGIQIPGAVVAHNLRLTGEKLVNGVKGTPLEGGLQPNEMGAVAATIRNEMGGFAPHVADAVTAGAITPEQADEIRNRVFANNPKVGADQQISPTQAALAHQFAAGTLPADQAARLSAATDLVHNEVLAPNQQAELDASGRLAAKNILGEDGMPRQAGLHPGQLGNTPMESKVAQMIQPLVDDLNRAQAEAFRAEAEGHAGALTAAHAKVVELSQQLAQARGAAEANPATAPSAWRPMIERSRSAVNAAQAMAAEAEKAGDTASAAALRGVADRIPVTLGQHVAQGVFAPEHMIGERPGRGLGLGTPKPSPLVGSATTQAMHVRSPENTLVASTPERLVKTYTSRRMQGIQNAHVLSVVEQAGTTPAKLLAAEGSTGEMTHAELLKAVESRGYRAVNPALPFTQGIITDPKMVGPDTPIVPAKLLDELNRRTQPLFQRQPGTGTKAVPAGLKVLDKATAAYRTSLHLSPAWALHRTATALFQAHVGADMSINDIIHYGTKAVSEMRGDTDLALGSRRTGLYATDEPTSKLGTLAHKAGTVNRATRDAANWGENALKVAVALKKIQESGGRLDDTAAMTEATKLMGDYGNSAAWERELMGRAFPVYPWLKMVAKQVAHYGVDHPQRAAFMLHLGNISAAATQQAGLPNSQIGSVPLGGGNDLNLQGLNPLSLFSGTAGGFMNPMLKLGVEAATGGDPNTMSQLTRPGGAFGGKQPTGRITNPSELEYLALKNNPLGRVALGQFAPNVARYNTGEPYLGKSGPTVYPADTSVAGRVLSAAGLPINNYTPSPNAAKSAAATAKADAAYKARQKANNAKTHIPLVPGS